ncbi:MAG TPA: hypothetical protein VMC08_07050, partial [Bacteroidales bacterium]|nr:hypothetical protein [Bacteroidales bacterium]
GQKLFCPGQRQCSRSKGLSKQIWFSSGFFFLWHADNADDADHRGIDHYPFYNLSYAKSKIHNPPSKIQSTIHHRPSEIKFLPRAL